MKLKLNDILNCNEGIQFLNELNLNARLSYKISKIVLAIEQEYQIIQQERLKIIQKYGARDKNGELIAAQNNEYTISKENIKIANEELNGLMDTEIELNVMPIELSELESYSIPPKYMIGLMPFIKE